MKGVAYQQDSAAGGSSTGSDTYVDPLASESNCKRDVPLLKALGTNAIRTYAIDPTKDHSACMKLLDDAGIYVSICVLQLNSLDHVVTNRISCSTGHQRSERAGLVD